jgi:hypothetical protein
VTGQRRIEDLLRECAPQVLAALVRRYGQFDAGEDAVQEALLAAAVRWPAEGVPDRPRSWLLTVAGRALVNGSAALSAWHVNGSPSVSGSTRQVAPGAFDGGVLAPTPTSTGSPARLTVLSRAMSMARRWSGRAGHRVS